MKKILFFLTLLSLCTSCATLKNQEQAIVTGSGWTIRAGDVVKLGKGSLPNGNFRYAKNDGWQTAVTVKSPDVSVNPDQTIIDKSYNYKQVTVDGIKGNNTLVIKTAAGGRMHIEVEEAIAAGELLVSQTDKVVEKTIIQETSGSVADELAKLKKLYDEGAITKKEYEAQKKKLLSK